MDNNYVDWDYPELIESESIANVIHDILVKYKNAYNDEVKKHAQEKKNREDNYNSNIEYYNKEYTSKINELNVEQEGERKHIYLSKEQRINEINDKANKEKQQRTISIRADFHANVTVKMKELEALQKKISDVRLALLNGKNSNLFYSISSSNNATIFSFMRCESVFDIDFTKVNNMVFLFNEKKVLIKNPEIYNIGSELRGFLNWADREIRSEKNRLKGSDEVELNKSILEMEKKVDDEYDLLKNNEEENCLYRIQSIDQSYYDKKVQIKDEIQVKMNSLYQNKIKIDSEKDYTHTNDLENIVNECINAFETQVPQFQLNDYVFFNTDENRIDLYEYKPRTRIPNTFVLGDIKIRSKKYFFNDRVKDYLIHNYPMIFSEDYLSLPYNVDFEITSNLCFEYGGDEEDIIDYTQALVSTILLSSPPKTAEFTLLDPVRSTNTFAPLNKFVDMDTVNSKILRGGIATSNSAIEEKLKIINEHMEYVISSCLKSNDTTIRQYNRQAGHNAEPYQYLFVMDFPAGFDSNSIKLLEKIIESGSRCGIYTVLMTSRKQLINADEAIKNTYENIKKKTTQFILNEDMFMLAYSTQFREKPVEVGINIIIDKMLTGSVIDKVAPIFKDATDKAGRIIIDFNSIKPDKEKWFTGSAKDEISIPLGLVSVDNVQNFKLGGDGISHHAIIAGESGSGKTTLLHTLITNALMKYSYQELEIYLVDFKRGVEFKVYGDYNLPNIKLVALESKRKFGYDTLEFLDREQKKRSDEFKKYPGCKNISQYREMSGNVMPRIMLIIDEYHELFNSHSNDSISSQSAELLQRVLSQGRAFGIHVILATQSISNVGGLNQSIYDLIAVRIALKCIQSEAQIVLGESADEVKLLTESGMAIYNYNYGEKQASSLFRISMIDNDEHMEILSEIGDAYSARNIIADTKVVDSDSEKRKDGTISLKYFDRCDRNIPKLSAQKRKPIILPFATDEEDNIVYCDFVGEKFASYIMGAAGSGKSTLLHSIISGLVMNHHPDELELWLMDFKMTEFNLYVDNCPPHIKYILLEKSEDLIMDFIDKLTKELDRRQSVFSENFWDNIDDVPVDVHMPVIFVIIDEFAQMSQVIAETKGMGYSADYTIKLENLLTKGRAFGFKFIFASQTYISGIRGLTDTAAKQIQMRFALKNTKDEIRETLSLNSYELTEEVQEWISNLQVHKTIFKVPIDEKTSRIMLLNNLYASKSEIIDMVNDVSSAIQESDYFENNDAIYKKKNPVFLDGLKPKTYESQAQMYESYEKSIDEDDYEENSIFVYPGVPCSLEQVKSFVLYEETAENVLMVGGKKENTASVVNSIIKSARRQNVDIEMWGFKRDSIVKKYKDIIFGECKKSITIEEICDSIKKTKESIMRRQPTKKIVFCFGYHYLSNEFELLKDMPMAEQTAPKQVKAEVGIDRHEFMSLVQKLRDDNTTPEEKEVCRARIREINKICEENNQVNDSSNSEGELSSMYDARNDFIEIIKKGPSCGVHFVLCFENPSDYLRLRMNSNDFKHKMAFSISRDYSRDILGMVDASKLDESSILYSSFNGKFTIRNHIHYGIPCNGWEVDEEGIVTRVIEE